MPWTSPKQRDAIIIAGLIIAILICYWQVKDHEFVNYDDHIYITRNPIVQQGVTWDGIKWAFTTLELASWHPLTLISHMIDCDLFRQRDGTQWPGGHHLMNIAFHMLNTIVLYLLLQRMTGDSQGWRSALVAALFALHPQHVESVAWVSERKDVLSTLFGLLAIAAYLRFVRTRTMSAYVMLASLFTASLMCKPMLVTLPALLVVLDYWPLRRFPKANGDSPTMAKLVIEKLPLLVIAIGISAITLAAQHEAGAVSSVTEVSILVRISNASVAYVLYLYQMAWPFDLAPLYPMRSWEVGIVLGACGLLTLVTMFVLALSRKRRELLVGWLWYLGTLVPVIGLVQIGSHSHADRYTYFPSIGIFIVLAWAIPAARQQTTALIYSIMAVVILAAMSYLTYLQVSYWRDSIVLSEHTLQVTDRNTYAHFNLANAYNEAGDLDQALIHFRTAAELFPNWSDPLLNMGNALRRASRLGEAVAAYQEGLSRNPDDGALHFNLGNTLAMANRTTEAIPHFARAVELLPNDPFVHMSMAAAMQETGQLDAAVQHLRTAGQLATSRGDERLLAEIHRRIQRASGRVGEPTPPQ